MQNYIVMSYEDTPFKEVRMMSSKKKKERKKRHRNESILVSDIDINSSQSKMQEISAMLHKQETNDSDSEKEVMDTNSNRMNSRNDRSVKHEQDTTGRIETVRAHGPPTEDEFIDKIIDETRDEFDHSTDDKKFKELEIFLPFEVPLSHTVENKITHGISEEEWEKLKELGIKFKTGRFNVEEDNILRANWESFSKLYGFSNPEPFLPGVKNCVRRDQKKKFVQWLGNGLENRSLNSIFSRFRLLYSDTSKTHRFSEFEDKIIKRCLEREVEMPFVLLSKILGRDRMYISKHYRMTKKASFATKEKVHWDMDLVKLFIEALLKATGCVDVEELRDKSLPPYVWDSIGESLEVPASRCRNFWNRKLSTQLFAEEPVYKYQLCNTLLLRFWKRRKEYVYWQDISWSRIAKYYKGFGPVFLAKTFKSFVRDNVPKEKWNSLKACLKYLRKEWLLKLPEIKISVSLTRLRYINGQLVVLADE